MSKEDLFNRVSLWLIERTIYNSAEIFASDQELGYILLSGDFHYSADESILGYTQINGLISYRLRIFVREGRYKYIVTDFYHHGSEVAAGAAHSYGPLTDGVDPYIPSMRKPKKVVWDDIRKVANNKTLELAKQLLIIMSTPTELEKEW